MRARRAGFRSPGDALCGSSHVYSAPLDIVGSLSPWRACKLPLDIRGDKTMQDLGCGLPRTPLPRRWVNRLFLDTPVNELLLGSALGTLVVLHFRREPPYDQQQLREQGAQKYQEESHAHSSAVVGLMHL